MLDLRYYIPVCSFVQYFLTYFTNYGIKVERILQKKLGVSGGWKFVYYIWEGTSKLIVLMFAFFSLVLMWKHRKYLVFPWTGEILFPHDWDVIIFLPMVKETNMNIYT